LVLLFVSLFGATLAARVKTTVPGFKSVISQSCINYVVAIGVEELLQQLSDLPLPDVTGQTSIPVIGTVKYKLTNLHIQYLTLPDVSVLLDPSVSGLSASVANSSSKLNFNWEYS